MSCNRLRSHFIRIGSILECKFQQIYRYKIKIQLHGISKKKLQILTIEKNQKDLFMKYFPNLKKKKKNQKIKLDFLALRSMLKKSYRKTS